MKLKILAVGTRMPDWVESGCSEYGKRMPPELRIETVEIALGARVKTSPPARRLRRRARHY